MLRWVYAHELLAIAATVAVAALVWMLRTPLAILFGAYLLASALEPLVRYLGRSGVPRLVSVVGIYICVLVALFGLLVPLGRILGGQLPGFASEMHTYAQTFSSMPGANLSSLVSGLQDQLLGITAGAISLVISLTTAFVASAYLLYDFERVEHILARFTKHAAALEALERRLREGMGSWVRGQLVLSALVGCAVFAALFALNIPFALLLGCIAALFELIPYIGPVLAALPAIVIALSQSPGEAVLVVIVYTIIQQAENHLLVPLVMRRAVNLHPIVIIFLILAGFELMGIAGGLIAVPLGSAVSILFRSLRPNGVLPSVAPE